MMDNQLHYSFVAFIRIQLEHSQILSQEESDVDTSNLGLKTSTTLTKKDIPKHLQFQPHKTQTQRSSSTHEGVCKQVDVNQKANRFLIRCGGELPTHRCYAQS